MPDSDTRGDDRFPSTDAELHRWISEHLAIDIARSPLVSGHAAPFDYIRHAFFEGGRLLGAGSESALDCVVWANRGGGKTFLGAVATLLDLVFKPGIEVRILGGSLEQSKRMLAHLRALFRAEEMAARLDGRITERRVRLRNGSSAEVLAQSETSVRGTRVQKLRCDEVEMFDPQVWEAAQLVTRSARLDLPGKGPTVVEGAIECLSTMHRPYGLMHRLVAEASDGGRKLFRWGVLDVLEPCEAERPCERCSLLPECGRLAKSREAGGHVRIDDAVRLKSRVSLAAWESEMLCRRPRRTDSVYPEFDPAVHVVGSGPSWRAPSGALLAGMDFGFRAPTVILWAVLDSAGALWVLAERVKTETILEEHAGALTAGPGVEGLSGPPDWVGVDPAGRQRNDQTGINNAAVLRRAGLSVRTLALRQHEGISLVRARLRPAVETGPRLFVHARCTHLIECLTRYHYAPERPESLVPEKDGWDHAADALRYLVQNLDQEFRCASARYTG